MAGKDYDPDKERAERRKLKKIIKKCARARRTRSQTKLSARARAHTRGGPPRTPPSPHGASGASPVRPTCHAAVAARAQRLSAAAPAQGGGLGRAAAWWCREEKGAARELRKDNYFLAEERQVCTPL